MDEFGSEAVWASPSPRGERTAASPPANVEVDGITLFARAHRTGCACDEQGRVPTGTGYWSGDDAHDWCERCFSVIPEEPGLRPSNEQVAPWARAGIDSTGHPAQLLITDGERWERLVALMGAHDVRRVRLIASDWLRDHPEVMGSAPAAIVVDPPSSPVLVSGGDSLRRYEQQLQGAAFGPPLDPALVARIEAAKDERGVIHDAELANEWFEAMVAQGEALRAAEGWPEPVIENGRVFPSLDSDAPPLG